MIIKTLTLGQSEEWSRIVKSFKHTDIYFSPDYFKAYKANGDGEPVLFYLENESGRVANIFLKRDISRDKNLTNLIKPDQYFDITTVYGYGGPLVEISDYSMLQHSFDEEFKTFCRKNSIVSDFVRFHCILGNHNLFRGIYHIENIRTTIYMDLSNGEQAVWDDLECTCRTGIQKAKKSGVTVEYGRDQRLVEKFKVLYKETMDRNNAAGYYYFNDKFFDTTLQELRDNSRIFTANFEGRIIAGALVIFGDELAHFHFGASDSNYLNLRPNNLLLYSAAVWACSKGKKIFHIGGGAAGADDNLFRFKKTFSKTNRLDFYIGKRTYDQEAYDYLVDLRIINDPNFNSETNFYPKYRG